MPDMKLSTEEAGHLAAYLNPKPASPGAVDKQLIKAGEAAYARYNCASCHEPEKARLRPITTDDQGCLATTVKKVPNFRLSDVQRESIRLVLNAKKPTYTPAQVVDHSMQTLNCYACHGRQGKGGVEEARRDYFHANDPDMHAVGDLGVYPPGLDVVGRKLTAEWLKKILVGKGGEVRPYLKTRMPRFEHAVVQSLLTNLPTADKLEKPIRMDTSGLARHHRGHYGRALLGTGKGGMACVTCHGLQGQPAIGSGVIDITQTVKRLQPGYFKELMLNPAKVQPGTIMPPLFTGRKKASQEIEQIWTYLKEAEQQKLPEGLLREDKYELFPEKQGKPIIFRTFIHGVGSHAIAVGHPEGVHAGFDAHASRWAVVWRGRFLDAGTTWTDRYSAPDKPLGSDVKALPTSPTFSGKIRFGGFRLDADNRPVFHYSVGKWRIEDQLRPQGKNLKRLLTIKGPNGELDYRPLTGPPRKVTIKDGKTTVEEVLTW
jgi:mono/diheme cytochrome c family protein